MAASRTPLPAASQASTTRAVFQAAEVALLNLEHLSIRSIGNLERRRFDLAAAKSHWCCGFHRLLSQLSLITSRTPPAAEGGFVSVQDSPAYSKYLAALKRVDATLAQVLADTGTSIEQVLADPLQNSDIFRILHWARIGSHEALYWDRRLNRVSVSMEVESLAQWVVADLMDEMVHAFDLQGDTFFVQFRGFHQIPEILALEANDRLEAAVVALRDEQPLQGLQHLTTANALCAGVADAMPVMVECLTIAEYHRIRENLGLTSGSHSMSLHYHLFRDLYQQSCHEIKRCAVSLANLPADDGDATVVFREIDARRYESQAIWVAHALLNELERLQETIDRWRSLHLHLPRNNLGGTGTKSLTGSPNAVETVRGMARKAERADPAMPLLEARSRLRTHETTPLSDYLERASLDHDLLLASGRLT